MNWRNPRIHGPERVKVWLACDEHVEYLRGYLASRGFPVAVTDAGVVASPPSSRWRGRCSPGAG